MRKQQSWTVSVSATFLVASQEHWWCADFSLFHFTARFKPRTFSMKTLSVIVTFFKFIQASDFAMQFVVKSNDNCCCFPCGQVRIIACREHKTSRNFLIFIKKSNQIEHIGKALRIIPKHKPHGNIYPHESTQNDSIMKFLWGFLRKKIHKKVQRTQSKARAKGSQSSDEGEAEQL